MKKTCAKFKGYGEKFPAFKSLLDQFPWARYDEQGVFQEGIVRESRGVLGSGSYFGYWATCDPATCRAPGDVCSDTLITLGELPEEKAGWKLPDDEIPWLKDARMKVPAFPATFEDSWKGYYEWRQLPLDSPAALLLHWPMSMFMCLRELGFVEEVPKLDAPRRELRVHCVGAAREMTVIPLFGELALLLPNTDLEITFISQEALMCTRFALMDGIVDSICPCAFEYTAPESLGSGTVRILLEGRASLYDPLSDPLFTSDPPDAIVALNAGLVAYPRQWYNVYIGALTKQIPFAITEYCEQSLTTTHSTIRTIVPQNPTVDQSSGWYKDMVATRPEWKMNPFMCPGMTLDEVPTAILPYAQNAFVYVVTPGRRD
ncbi:hypothetical protein EV421DRAFT_762322 [Armillaria borealis]|uniref:Mitochondrial splicing suppressor 51-like C-terminal domain-containing protein n=1 Tax=Armillaria borealis TaxID=47425 RepID=A0AA39MPA0_9AGAR|nr:hypothetical protein EV421DRAFT_762322 [Armillaria borealis]